MHCLYANNLKLADFARLDRLQYRAAKLVTGALHFTSREELNFLGLSFFPHKIHLLEIRPLIQKRHNLIGLCQQIFN
jgi:hypothetical protein